LLILLNPPSLGGLFMLDVGYLLLNRAQFHITDIGGRCCKRESWDEKSQDNSL
jgi:hypothetical protein